MTELKLKSKQQRQDVTINIDLSLVKPTAKTYSDFDLREICDKLEVNDNDDDASKSEDLCSTESGDSPRGEYVAEYLMDKGQGYDLDDDFVDDSDVYHCKQNRERKIDGYYVQRGAVEYD